MKLDIRKQLRERFDRNDTAIHGGRGYSEFTNENGELAWAETGTGASTCPRRLACGWGFAGCYLAHRLRRFIAMPKKPSPIKPV